MIYALIWQLNLISLTGLIQFFDHFVVAYFFGGHPVYKPDILAVQARKSAQIGLINRALSHIHGSEFKVAAFSCLVDIWFVPYQFFNTLQSCRWSEPNTVLQ